MPTHKNHEAKKIKNPITPEILINLFHPFSLGSSILVYDDIKSVKFALHFRVHLSHISATTNKNGLKPKPADYYGGFLD